MTTLPLVVDTRTLPSRPWKNGGGTTRNLAVSPEGAGFDDFLWRISIAEVRESDSFSHFPGVDRIIMLLEGNGMTLRDSDGGVFSLTVRFAPHAFSGEASIEANLVDGPTIDFNVMVRRGRTQAALNAWTTPGELPHGGSEAVFYCAQGVFDVTPVDPVCAVRLKEGDMLRMPRLTSATKLAPAAPGSVLLSALIVAC